MTTPPDVTPKLLDYTVENMTSEAAKVLAQKSGRIAKRDIQFALIDAHMKCEVVLKGRPIEDAAYTQLCTAADLWNRKQA